MLLIWSHFRVPKTLTFNTGLSYWAKRKTFLVKMCFVREWIRNHFHMNSFALSPALKQRLGVYITRKLPITNVFRAKGYKDSYVFFEIWIFSGRFTVIRKKLEIAWAPKCGKLRATRNGNNYPKGVNYNSLFSVLIYAYLQPSWLSFFIFSQGRLSWTPTLWANLRGFSGTWKQDKLHTLQKYSLVPFLCEKKRLPTKDQIFRKHSRRSTHYQGPRNETPGSNSHCTYFCFWAYPCLQHPIQLLTTVIVLSGLFQSKPFHNLWSGYGSLESL